jgi:hypothetical protein
MKAVKLLVKAHYRSRDVILAAGSQIEVPQDEAEFLLRDAPGCFEVVGAAPPVEEEKAPDEPPVDKMVRREGSSRK